MQVDDLVNRFTYHRPTQEQAEEVFPAIRNAGLIFATMLSSLCPEGREKSLAITKIEEAVFWANAAIARANG